MRPKVQTWVMAMPADAEFVVNTLRPRWNGQHFPDDIFKCIFYIENVSISIKISLKFVSKDPIKNIASLLQIGAGAIQATSHYLNQMMTSSNGNIFHGPGEFPAQRPVTRIFDVFFDLRLNKRLSKQPWGWWFERPSWSLWRQCNEWWFVHQGIYASLSFNELIRSYHLHQTVLLLQMPWWLPAPGC